MESRFDDDNIIGAMKNVLVRVKRVMDNPSVSYTLAVVRISTSLIGRLKCYNLYPVVGQTARQYAAG